MPSRRKYWKRWAPALQSMLQEKARHDRWEKEPSPVYSGTQCQPGKTRRCSVCFQSPLDVPFPIELIQSLLDRGWPGLPKPFNVFFRLAANPLIDRVLGMSRDAFDCRGQHGFVSVYRIPENDVI